MSGVGNGNRWSETVLGRRT